jgi:phosphate/phosphite/phosphonate ABC transporter binding protein
MERLETKILSVIALVLVLGCMFAISVVIYMEKSSLQAVTDLRTAETAAVVTKGIERTMIEAKADITRSLVNDLETSRGVEEVTVYNSEGREAFSQGRTVLAADVMAELMTKKDVLTRDSDGKHLVFKPLLNTARCQECHSAEKAVLGAVQISVSRDFEKTQLNKMLVTSILASLLAIIALTLLMLVALRKVVIKPVNEIEKASLMLADGDLSFPVDIKAQDEISRLSQALNGSFYSISGILRRVKEVSQRISKVSAVVELESQKVLEGTQVEAQSIENISSSVDQLNVSIAEISEGSDSLAATVEEIAASMEQMSASISQIGRNTLDLFSAMEDTSASIEEMSITIREVAEGSDNLASSSIDTTAAMEQLDASIKEVDKNAKESSSLSKKVLEDASNVGLTSVEKTMDGMKKIKEAVERTATIIRGLGDRSEEVGKILNVIDEITEQTTLLALNAAILASQAGEHGKGFSVVADEIKDLAERTSFSTQEIATLIGSVQNEVSGAGAAMDEGVASVEEGFRLANNSAEALKKIVDSAKKSSEMSFAIEKTTEQQAGAIASVTRSMERIRTMVNSIARSTSEQTKGASLIMEATEKVRDITAQVKNASEEQSSSSSQVAKAMEAVSDHTQQISIALREQREGAGQIKEAVGQIQLLPEENRDRAYTLNRSLKDLKEDADLMMTELKRFKLQDVGIKEGFTFGVVPIASPAEMFNKFGPLIDYLTKKTGKKFELKIAMNLAEAVKDITDGISQICYLTPSTYIKAHKGGGVRVIAKALRDGKPFHHSVIITRPDSGILSVEDLKGKSFAFGDKDSTSSHIVPRHMLKAAGIELMDLLNYDYLKRQDAVAEAVLNGEFDAGGVMESTALKYKEEGLTLVKYSEEIPEFNICVNRLIPEEEIKTILDAILALDDSDIEGSTILKSIDGNYSGFSRADDSDYNGIRDMMNRLDII